ncbi:hypothetical protein LCGC14_1947790 [marine sediment metagenome]|uniref:CBS domain-containing protein n=1 Tax=marine sediment metagenome TaxID=412755 RepID=A0A0F9G6T1_9ZZZZ
MSSKIKWMIKLKPKFYDFWELFEKNLTVEQIASELECWNPEIEEEQEAIKKMNDNDFDLLPIIRSEGICEYLTIDSERKNIVIDELISNSMPLTHILDLFRIDPERKFFILKEKKIDGILTIGDLQKGPFCLLIFGLITNFEIICYELIKNHYDSDWEKVLSPDRLKDINKIHNEKKEKGEEIDKLYCSTLSNKITLIRKIQDFNTILENIGWSKKGTRVLLTRITRLRNNLAHARYIKSEFKKWDDLIETIEKIRALTLKIREYLEIK